MSEMLQDDVLEPNLAISFPCVRWYQLVRQDCVCLGVVCLSARFSVCVCVAVKQETDLPVCLCVCVCV